MLFGIESFSGQFDQRASSQEALLLLGSSNDVTVNSAIVLVTNAIDVNELEAVKTTSWTSGFRFKDITVGIKQDFSLSLKTIPSLDFERYTAEDSLCA